MAKLKGFFTEPKKRKLSIKVVHLRTKRQYINKIDALRHMQGLPPSGYSNIIESVDINILKTELAEMKQLLEYQYS